MECVEHPGRDAVDTCAECGGGVCEFCRTVVEGGTYCPSCAQELQNRPLGLKHPLMDRLRSRESSGEMTLKEAGGWTLIVLGWIVLAADLFLGLPIGVGGLIYGGAWAIDQPGSVHWLHLVGPVMVFIAGLAIGSGAIYTGHKMRHPDMSNIVIGWVTFALGIVAILILLLLLLILLASTVCLGLWGSTVCTDRAPWSQTAVPFACTIFVMVVSGLAVWGGWRLAHPHRRGRRDKPAIQPPDEPTEES